MVVVIVLLAWVISIAPVDATNDSFNGVSAVDDSVEPMDSTHGNLTYVLIDDDTEVNITGHIGSGGNVTIPSTIEGKPVTGIGIAPFSSCSDLASIDVAEGNVTFVSVKGLLCDVQVNTIIQCPGLHGHGIMIDVSIRHIDRIS